MATNILDPKDLHHIYSLSSDIIFKITRDGTLLFVNPKFLNVLNYDEKDIHGASFFELLSQHSLVRIKKIAGNKTESPSEKFTASIKDSNNQQQSISLIVTPVEDGKALLCIGQEVIDIEQKEEELKSALNEISYVQEALDQYAIVATTDRKGKITYVNQKFCDISKYSREELIGSDHRLLNSEHHSKEFMKELWDTINSGEVWKGRIKNKNKEGGYYWVETTIVPFKDENGNAFRFTAIRFEITDQINLVNNLEEAKIIAEKNAAAKDQFLANMSHEIRTPMNAIIGFTDVLRSTFLTEEQQEFVDAIGTSGENLLVIINDILDSSKIETNNLKLEYVPVNVSEILSQIQKILSLKAKDKHLNLTVSTDLDVPTWVVGDPVRLNQILVNIANNAIKFTEEGTVDISCVVLEENENECVLEFKVKDTGIGIPKDKLVTVFERFQQAEDYTTRKYGGTGLGLSIAKQLVELFGGEIKISSKVGVGTQFKIIIPFQIPSEKPVQAEEMMLNADALENLRVLLAEDNLLNQKLAQNIMKNFRIDLTIVNNGQEAIDILKERAFDIVLMDLQMPIMDGHTATRKIINELKLDIPIIAMTAHSLVGEQQKCYDVGMTGFLSKPYKVKDLVRVLTEQNLMVRKNEDNKTEPKHNSTFDLKNLVQISNNDQAFIKETIELVIKTIPDTIREIDDSEKERDLDKLKKSIHKIKPTIIMFDHAKIRSLNAAIEEGQWFEDIESDIPQLRTLLGEFITDLKAVS